MTPKQKKHWLVITELMKHLPEDVTIVSDMTQIAYTAVEYLPLNRPNSWLHPTGYGTLGYALPAAIGAVLADQSRPALVLVGDAGLQYTFQEMTLAAELDLNIVILLWNNNALQQIHDDMNEARIQPVGVHQQNPGFIALALACGWRARIVASLTSLGSELQDAFDQTGPVLLRLDENLIPLE
jgi:5-guanidino-2-oxopentanoate decarboxylase